MINQRFSHKVLTIIRIANAIQTSRRPSSTCCGSLVPQSCETTVSRSTAGTTGTLRVEEHTCRSWRCGEPGRTESWIRKVLSSLQHPVEALGGFAQGGGSFQPYPPPDTAGVDPSDLLVLNLTVEIHSPVKQGLSKPCWPSDHLWATPWDWGTPHRAPSCVLGFGAWVDPCEETGFVQN